MPFEARNCTFACTYCYVPTVRIYGGLKPVDWTHWGRFTTFKNNVPELLHRGLNSGQIIYCSPFVYSYQTAAHSEAITPPLLERDADRLSRLAERTTVRASSRTPRIVKRSAGCMIRTARPLQNSSTHCGDCARRPGLWQAIRHGRGGVSNIGGEKL